VQSNPEKVPNARENSFPYSRHGNQISVVLLLAEFRDELHDLGTNRARALQVLDSNSPQANGLRLLM
jgi:hypothetical protein